MRSEFTLCLIPIKSKKFHLIFSTFSFHRLLFSSFSEGGIFGSLEGGGRGERWRSVHRWMIEKLYPPPSEYALPYTDIFMCASTNRIRMEQPTTYEYIGTQTPTKPKNFHFNSILKMGKMDFNASSIHVLTVTCLFGIDLFGWSRSCANGSGQ